MNKQVGIVIQARMGSTRLPGKVLMEFCSKPMLGFLIDLLYMYNLGLDIIVATSINSKDDKIKEYCDKNNILCYRGSEKNVFKRFCGVATEHRFDHIIRLTGDNPLPFYSVIDLSLKRHLKFNPDLTSTREFFHDQSIKRYIPKGLSVDVINCNSLLKIDESNLNNFEREHVVPPFFKQNYNIKIIKDFNVLNKNLTVDTFDDFKIVSKYASELIDNGKLLNILGYQS